ncbi:uncharacterized protein B0H18DRAFT_1031573 [Fomitopsis serialis]|uniref:uncharacterized protein n=1 Tax=Fomitopsis serialis TaxID=139415 RepID=UPI002008710C|nr:uncharacterized protein B0H18DRAFT_1031573 [Neoantrodia serialis]KAH9918326.1 hypothetical protein B0H18DRAFT_1031573 [Neoantrodia serialis]
MAPRSCSYVRSVKLIYLKSAFEQLAVDVVLPGKPLIVAPGSRVVRSSGPRGRPRPGRGRGRGNGTRGTRGLPACLQVTRDYVVVVASGSRTRIRAWVKGRRTNGSLRPLASRQVTLDYLVAPGAVRMRMRRTRPRIGVSSLAARQMHVRTVARREAIVVAAVHQSVLELALNYGGILGRATVIVWGSHGDRVSERGSSCRRQKDSGGERRVTHDVVYALGSLRWTSVEGT